MPKHSVQTAIHPPFIVSATEPTTGSVGFTLQENHVWVDTNEDPAVYKRATGVVAGVVDEWVEDNPGATGADGLGVNWTGAWSSLTAYVENDAVTHDGSSYICITGHTDEEPPSAVFWDVLADVGATGATGAGVPTGGTASQYLRKIDGTDFNTEWDSLTSADVGLANVDNTSDATKNAAAVTLTNKTLTTPTIADLTNMQHDHLDANDGGTLTAAAISDFDTQVRTSTLNQMTAPTTDLSINSHKLTNVTDPSGAQDAATKAYVDAVARGLDWKASVRVASTANGTLATDFENGDTVDGVVLATGDRILLKDQTSGAENGIYVVAASGAPARATDADVDAEVTTGLACFVGEGTTNGNTTWVLTTNDPITLDTTALVFAQLGGGTGGLLAANNLSDVANAGTARTNLGLAIGTNVQAFDADLGVLAGLAKTRGNLIRGGASDWEAVALGTAGKVLASDGTDALYEDIFAALTFVIDGGGTVITTGIKGDLLIPDDYTIVSATALADQSGSIVVDVWQDTYANYPPADADSITASAPVTISGATKSQDTTLTGWDTTLDSGSILRFNVDSCTSVQRVTVALRVKRR